MVNGRDPGREAVSGRGTKIVRGNMIHSRNYKQSVTTGHGDVCFFTISYLQPLLMYTE